MKNFKNTEERILDAAIKIFSEKGYSGATTSEIAKEAGVAEGTIFRYFPKKKELLHAIVIKAIDIFGQNIIIDSLEEIIEENKNKNMDELLKAIILNRVKIFREYFPYAKVILYEIQFHEDVRNLFVEKIVKEGIRIGKDVIEEGKKRGEIKDIDPIIIIRSLIGMVLMMLMQRELIPEENFSNDIEDEIDMLIDIFLNGIKAR